MLTQTRQCTRCLLKCILLPPLGVVTLNYFFFFLCLETNACNCELGTMLLNSIQHRLVLKKIAGH